MINIYRYRVAANIAEYHFVSKLIFLRIIHDEYDKALIISRKNVDKLLKIIYQE